MTVQETLLALVAEVEALDAKATPGPLYWSVIEDPTEACEWFLNAFRQGQGPTHLVVSKDGDKEIKDSCLCPAITGNGPTSEANAHFFIRARALLPRLAAVLRVVAENLHGHPHSALLSGCVPIVDLSRALEGEKA